MIKRPIHIPQMLCEAYHYANPVPFSRGTHLNFGNVSVLLLSGTASVNEKGESVHIGDLEAQATRTFENITALLEAENMNWGDVVFTRIYLRDIDRDYQRLSRMRMAFFKEQGIEQYPASTCVEARLCRSELLVEIETVAVKDHSDSAD